MAWIEVHEELRTHPKVTRLARELGVSKAESRGLVIGLLLWACTYAPDGDLSRIESLDLADGCDYEGEKDFKAALVVARFIDQDGDRYVIHDWDQMGLKMLTSSQSRQKKYRERVDASSAQSNPESTPAPDNVTPTSPKRNGDVGVTSYLTIPNHTKPKATAPDKPLPPKPEILKIERQGEYAWLEQFLLEQWGRRGRVGWGVLEKLIDLGKKYTPGRLRFAIEEAAAHDAAHLKYVTAILESKKSEEITPDRIKRLEEMARVDRERKAKIMEA